MKQSEACTNCCKHKIYCDFANEGDDTCVKCAQTGAMCITQESHTWPAWGRSALPANLTSQESRAVHNNTTGMTWKYSNSCKRGGSQVPCSPPPQKSQPSKQQCQSCFQEFVAVAPSQSSGGLACNPSLDPILEIRDDQDDFDINIDMSNSLECGTNNFMSSLSVGQFQLENDFYGEPHEDVYYGVSDNVDTSVKSGMNLSLMKLKMRSHNIFMLTSLPSWQHSRHPSNGNGTSQLARKSQ